MPFLRFTHYKLMQPTPSAPVQPGPSVQEPLALIAPGSDLGYNCGAATAAPSATASATTAVASVRAASPAVAAPVIMTTSATTARAAKAGLGSGGR